MHDIEILERRELAVRRQRRRHEELDLAAAGAQSVAGVDAQFLTHALDHPTDLSFEILRIIDNVEIRMADPGGRGFVVELASEFDALGTTCVLLRGVELLGAVRGRNHVDDLVIPGRHERENKMLY